jgi:hypothetical protein
VTVRERLPLWPEPKASILSTPEHMAGSAWAGIKKLILIPTGFVLAQILALRNWFGEILFVARSSIPMARKFNNKCTLLPIYYWIYASFWELLVEGINKALTKYAII